MRSVLLVAALATTAYADAGKRDVDAANAMLDAARSATPADAAKLMAAPLRYTDITFNDPDCAKRFASSGTVAKRDLARFAACMASMRGLSGEFWFGRLTTDKPEHRTEKFAIGDTTVLVDPHTHLVAELVHRNGRHDDEDDDDENGEEGGIAGGVVDQGSPPPPPPPPPPPEPRTVTMSDIVGHLHAGSTMVRPDADELAKMRAGKRTTATVDLFMCFNSKGDAIGARIKQASDYPRWDAMVTKAAMKMSITPLDGTIPNQAVCANITFTTGPIDKAH